MFKMTAFIIFAERLSRLRFFQMAPFFHRIVQHGPFFFQVGMNTSEPMSD